MEQSIPGFIAFVSSQMAAFTPTHIDLSRIIAALNGIRDPGPAPTLQTLIVVPNDLRPAPLPPMLISFLSVRAYVVIVASATGAILSFFGNPVTYFGLVFLAAGFLLNIIVPKELRRLREARSQAETTWRTAQEAWTQQSSNRSFAEIKSQVDILIRSLSDLPDEERRELQLLERKKLESQLTQYLERFLIAKSKIRKIGAGRKATLASFGVETAADLNQQKLFEIQGFGPTLVTALMTWRQGILTKFVFNPNEPINQRELTALRIKIASRKGALEGKIRSGLTGLQQASNLCLGQRRRLSDTATRAFVGVKQAELNDRIATGPLQKSSKWILICCAILSAIGFISTQEALIDLLLKMSNPV
jgi:hypothetical protein